MKRQTTLLQAVIVLGGFLALAFLCNQSGIEIHLALFAAWFLAMAVGKRNGFSYQEMEHAVTKGIYDGMSAILILLADRKSTRLNSSHWNKSRMPSSA